MYTGAPVDGTPVCMEPTCRQDSELSRVLRGGSWLSPALSISVTRRRFEAPDDRGIYLGFRIRRTPSP